MVGAESLRNVRYQDFGVVIALICAVFILKAPDVYNLKPVWRLDLKEYHGDNILPLPVIADLDNDGVNEMVLVDTSGMLKVMTFPSHDPAGHSILPHLHTKHEVLVNYNSTSVDKPFPVAIATGCLHGMVQGGTCYQSIVVVTSDWSVHLYDHYLNIIWKKSVSPKPKLFHFREIAAFIISHGNDGLVLVGGRAGTKSHDKQHLSHTHGVPNNISKETLDQLSKEGFHKSAGDSSKVLDEDHFSTYALGGSDGSIIWSHKPGDFEVNTTSRESVLSSYHFKLSLHKGQHHIGEEHWTKYRSSILQILPHRWHHPADTTLTTSHFTKSSRKESLSSKEKSWFDIRTPNLDLFNSDTDKNTQKKEQNAVVIHNKHGIEVLLLKSGRPLWHFKSNKDGMTLGDVNNDGAVDHISTRFTSRDDYPPINSLTCTAIVTSESRVLFDNPICQTLSLFGGMFDDDMVHEEEILPVPPVVVSSPPHRSGILRHLMGKNLRRSKVGLDSIFYVSTGKVTSFGPHGELNWQVKVNGKWNIHSLSLKQNNINYFPSMKTFPLELGNEKEILILTSWLSISLVDIIDGTIMASHTLPCQSMSPVVNGDFTNDGLSDVVVQCSDSYLGFALERSFNYIWTAIWLASGLFAVSMAVLTMRIFEEVVW